MILIKIFVSLKIYFTDIKNIEFKRVKFELTAGI